MSDLAENLTVCYGLIDLNFIWLDCHWISGLEDKTAFSRLYFVGQFRRIFFAFFFFFFLVVCNQSFLFFRCNYFL